MFMMMQIRMASSMFHVKHFTELDRIELGTRVVSLLDHPRGFIARQPSWWSSVGMALTDAVKGWL